MVVWSLGTVTYPALCRLKQSWILYRMIDITALHTEIAARLPAQYQALLEMHLLDHSGLQVRVDGAKCLSNIGVWPNGCCDVEHLFVESESGDFQHFEFSSVAEAIELVLREIHAAIERAR